MKIIILFGPPGVGKGTQAALLAQSLSYKHVSTGQMLREAIANKTPLGNQVAPLIQAGHLVSDDLIIKIVEEFLGNNLNEKGILLDGFPRTIKQAELLNQLLKNHSISDVKVLNITANNEELMKRLMGRAKQEGRADDNPETIKNRLKVYEEQTFPILGFYSSSMPKSIINISGLGSVDEIQKNILNSLK